MASTKTLPLPLVAYLVAIAIEVGEGTLLVLGFQARRVAIVMAIFCVATAAVGFHHDFADQNQLIHFLKNIAMAGGLLQVVAFGAGAPSLDARRNAAGETTLQARVGAVSD